MSSTQKIANLQNSEAFLATLLTNCLTASGSQILAGAFYMVNKYTSVDVTAVGTMGFHTTKLIQ
jgi:hypothetical protein